MDVQGIYSILDRIAFETRRRLKIFNMNTWVESLEALIVAKLSMYYSDQSVKDVISVIELNKDQINTTLLFELANKVGVKARVREILSRYIT